MVIPGPLHTTYSNCAQLIIPPLHLPGPSGAINHYLLPNLPAPDTHMTHQQWTVLLSSQGHPQQ